MATAVPQRTRIDWAAAKARYVGLPTTERSFRRVGREFKVSEQTVAKHARREGWLQAAAEADRRAAEKALEQSMRTREQRAAQTARLRDLSADSLEAEFTVDDEGNVTSALDPSTRVQVWKEADRQYRLDIGEATDRIEVREVREFVQRFVLGFDDLVVAALDEHLANGKRTAILARIRAGTRPLLEQAATIEAGS